MSSEPLHDVRDISRIAYGFMGSKALFSALQVDLFTRLADRPLDLSELASVTGVAEHRLTTLLSALAGLGLVVREDGRWRNAPAAQRYLVTTAAEAFGDYYRLQVDELIYPMLQHLSAGLQGRVDGLAPGLAADEMADADRAARFSRAQHAGSLGPATVLARRIDVRGARHLLDIAGGTGAFTIRLCQANPDLTATIIDFPNVVGLARQYVTDAGLSDRVQFLEGNALDVSWPSADVVLMSYLLSAVAGDDIPVLLERAAASLLDGGQLLIHDFMLDDDRLGPDLAALWFLQYLAERIDSWSFTAADLHRHLAGSGFADIRDEVLVPQITKLVSATTPR
jgi:ubiquinone/menaquinone biosynthesis C-methylase UbiE